MIIYTMGFAQKNAERFFNLIKNNGIEVLIDIRLNNKSQLAGFTKGSDLPFLLKEICNCQYVHKSDYAPTKEILSAYQKKEINWHGYEERFVPLMEKRKIELDFKKTFSNYKKVCLLCTEPTPEMCHRRLVAVHLKNHIEDITILHI